MLEARPSRTAQRVAMRRATHQMLDDPPVFRDPLAAAIAGESEQPDAAREPSSRALRAFLAVRSRYAEDQLALAVERGARQYVVLGAGLDTFAYRNAFPGLHVFEVDHPRTQQWKRERLRAAAITIPSSMTFAAVDFEKQSLDDGLRNAGFDGGRPAFFSWLGVTPYLSREAFDATIRFIAGMPSSSAVVFDYAVPRARLDPAQLLAFDALASRVARAGEPFRLFFDSAELRSDLARLGFIHIEDWNAGEINARYFSRRKDGLAVSGGGHLLCAQVS